MSDWYILKHRKPIKCNDDYIFSCDFSRDKFGIRVRRTYFDKCYVSTVFLRLDHGWGGAPLLFETMIFGNFYDGYCERCATWRQALAMHWRAVYYIKELTNEDR
jgi:hypothetical protein